MSVTGDPAGGPAKCGVPISDFSTGLYCAYAIVSALRDVSASGQGHYIDMSLLGATLGVSALQTSEFFGTGRSPRRLGSAHPRNAPYEAFKASDVWFVMAAGNDKLWQSVCKVVGLEELIADPRFITNSDRADHQEELRVILNAIFGQKPAQVWLHELEKLGIPCGPINTFADALADEQVASMGWVQGIELPGGIKTQTFGCPIRLDGKTLPIRRNPPELGQHNSEILPSSRGKRVSAQEKDDAAATAL
jgi:crotonobetainyl-CoA:carnitine CoA-transferase CaiB-like acyl-CoA transferase